MSKPIIEFKTQEELDASLAEWQERLFLSDWIIKATLSDPGTLAINGERVYGINEYQAAIKVASVRIERLTDDTKDRIAIGCQELTLVHELLHCKFLFTDNTPSTTEGGFMGLAEHQLIEQMAKSLIMAKYGIKFDWFKNF